MAAAASALCLLSARLLNMLAMCCEAAAVAAAELAVLPGSEAGLVDRRGGGGGGVSAVEGKRQLAPPPVEAPDALSNSSRILVGCDLRLLDILQESWSMYLVSPIGFGSVACSRVSGILVSSRNLSKPLLTET